MKRLIFAVVLAALFAAQAAWSLDVTQGVLKLTLYESSGRFSLAALTDSKKGTYTPFFLDKDPRTSFLAIAVGNKVYKMGESAEFRQATERSDTGARFVWTSAMITVYEEFSFITSVGGGQADGIQITLTVKNNSDKTLGVGVRYLFDTYLGEASYVHFKTDKIAEINRELTLTKEDGARYWLSPASSGSDQTGLMYMLSGSGLTLPDKVVFGNWKRVSDAAWGYETSASRNFNLMPYSVNDSAVSMTWDPREIAKGQELTIVQVMGRYSPEGFAARGAQPSAAATAAPSAAAAASTTSPAASGAKPIIRITDLDALNALISRIDQRINSGTPITDDELARLTQALEDLKARAGDSSGK